MLPIRVPGHSRTLTRVQAQFVRVKVQLLCLLVMVERYLKDVVHVGQEGVFLILRSASGRTGWPVQGVTVVEIASLFSSLSATRRLWCLGAGLVVGLHALAGAGRLGAGIVHMGRQILEALFGAVSELQARW
jgi:hypothetical protein